MPDRQHPWTTGREPVEVRGSASRGATGKMRGRHPLGGMDAATRDARLGGIFTSHARIKNSAEPKCTRKQLLRKTWRGDSGPPKSGHRRGAPMRALHTLQEGP